ncbi:MAG: hypothetical protein JST92_27775 [Deltaproteobacteria bacterium]|nr:hypothetical protein [Deltaproteobacteria bacterium]
MERFVKSNGSIARTARATVRLARLGLGLWGLVAGALTACATLPPRERLGDASIRSLSDISASPMTIGVQTGRVVSGNIDFALDTDGCGRGLLGSVMLVLCPKQAPPALEPGVTTERWVGVGGEVTLELAKDGESLRADGYLKGQSGQTSQIVLQLPFGKGAQWDELRKHPILYVVAATVNGISGEGGLASP